MYISAAALILAVTPRDVRGQTTNVLVGADYHGVDVFQLLADRSVAAFDSGETSEYRIQQAAVFENESDISDELPTDIIKMLTLTLKTGDGTCTVEKFLETMAVDIALTEKPLIADASMLADCPPAAPVNASECPESERLTLVAANCNGVDAFESFMNKSIADYENGVTDDYMIQFNGLDGFTGVDPTKPNNICTLQLVRPDGTFVVHRYTNGASANIHLFSRPSWSFAGLQWRCVAVFCPGQWGTLVGGLYGGFNIWGWLFNWIISSFRLGLTTDYRLRLPDWSVIPGYVAGSGQPLVLTFARPDGTFHTVSFNEGDFIDLKLLGIPLMSDANLLLNCQGPLCPGRLSLIGANWHGVNVFPQLMQSSISGFSLNSGYWLRQLVGSWDFSIANPAPGIMKTLTLTFLTADGQCVYKTYRDGQQIDIQLMREPLPSDESLSTGADSRCPPPQTTGRTLVGADYHGVDIMSQIVGSSLSAETSGFTIGWKILQRVGTWDFSLTNPAPAVSPKILTLTFLLSNGTCVRETYQDGTRVDIQLGGEPSVSDATSLNYCQDFLSTGQTLVSASYDGVDVFETMIQKSVSDFDNQLTAGYRLVQTVGDATFANNDENAQQTLRLRFLNSDGTCSEEIYAHGDVLNIKLAAKPLPSDKQRVSECGNIPPPLGALVAADYHGIDVWQHFADQAITDHTTSSLYMIRDVAQFGPTGLVDPAPGVRKTVTLVFELPDGTCLFKTFQDGERITALLTKQPVVADKVKARKCYPSCPDRIVSATWGISGRIIDVTQHLCDGFYAGTFSVENIGLWLWQKGVSDPAFGQLKTLTVTFANNAVLNFREGAPVLMQCGGSTDCAPTSPPTPPVNECPGTFTRAVFGADERKVDVKDVLCGTIVNGGSPYELITSHVGRYLYNSGVPDPYFNKFKNLEITFSDGTIKSFPENGDLRIQCATVNPCPGSAALPLPIDCNDRALSTYQMWVNGAIKDVCWCEPPFGGHNCEKCADRGYVISPTINTCVKCLSDVTVHSAQAGTSIAVPFNLAIRDCAGLNPQVTYRSNRNLQFSTAQTDGDTATIVMPGTCEVGTTIYVYLLSEIIARVECLQPISFSADTSVPVSAFVLYLDTTDFGSDGVVMSILNAMWSSLAGSRRAESAVSVTLTRHGHPNFIRTVTSRAELDAAKAELRRLPNVDDCSPQTANMRNAGETFFLVGRLPGCDDEAQRAYASMVASVTAGQCASCVSWVSTAGLPAVSTAIQPVQYRATWPHQQLQMNALLLQQLSQRVQVPATLQSAQDVAQFLQEQANTCGGSLTLQKSSVPRMKRQAIEFDGLCNAVECCVKLTTTTSQSAQYGTRCQATRFLHTGKQVCDIPLLEVGAHTLTIRSKTEEKSTSLNVVKDQSGDHSYTASVFMKDGAYWMRAAYKPGTALQRHCCQLVGIDKQWNVQGPATWSAPMCWTGAEIMEQKVDLPSTPVLIFNQSPSYVTVQCDVDLRATVKDSETDSDDVESGSGVLAASAAAINPPTDRAWRNTVNRYVEKAMKISVPKRTTAGGTNGWWHVQEALAAAGLFSREQPEAKSSCGDEEPAADGFCYYRNSKYARDAAQHLESMGFRELSTDASASNAVRGDIVVKSGGERKGLVLINFGNSWESTDACFNPWGTWGAGTSVGLNPCNSCQCSSNPSNEQMTCATCCCGWSTLGGSWVGESIERDVGTAAYSSVKLYRLSPLAAAIARTANREPQSKEEGTFYAPYYLTPAQKSREYISSPEGDINTGLTKLFLGNGDDFVASTTPAVQDRHTAERIAQVHADFPCPMAPSGPFPFTKNTMWNGLPRMALRGMRRISAFRRSEFAEICYEMSSSRIRRAGHGVRCCYDKNFDYIPRWPSRIFIASNREELAQERQMERTMCGSEWSGSVTTVSSRCAEFSAMCPPSPGTNMPINRPQFGRNVLAYNPFKPNLWAIKWRSGWGHGDPHCQTIDGLRYMCNFQGEALWALCSEWKVHVVASQHNGEIEATVITAVAVQYKGDTAQVTTTEAFLNGEAVMSSASGADGMEVEVEGIQVQGLTHAKIITSDQNEVDIYVGEGRLTIGLNIQESCKGNVRGLVGNANGDASDDLTIVSVEGTARQFPTGSKEAQIYFEFVVPHLITEQELSLFNGRNLPLGDTAFVPSFFEEGMYRDCADACGDDMHCCFDFIAGGEPFKEMFDNERSLIDEANINARAFNSNWPPIVSGHDVITIMSSGKIMDATMEHDIGAVSLTAVDEDGVVNFTCEECDARADLKCEMQTINSTASSVVISGTFKAPETLHCIATDGQGAGSRFHMAVQTEATAASNSKGINVHAIWIPIVLATLCLSCIALCVGCFFYRRRRRDQSRNLSKSNSSEKSYRTEPFAAGSNEPFDDDLLTKPKDVHENVNPLVPAANQMQYSPKASPECHEGAPMGSDPHSVLRKPLVTPINLSKIDSNQTEPHVESVSTSGISSSRSIVEQLNGTKIVRRRKSKDF